MKEILLIVLWQLKLVSAFKLCTEEASFIKILSSRSTSSTICKTEHFIENEPPWGIEEIGIETDLNFMEIIGIDEDKKSITIQLEIILYWTESELGIRGGNQNST